MWLKWYLPLKIITEIEFGNGTDIKISTPKDIDIKAESDVIKTEYDISLWRKKLMLLLKMNLILLWKKNIE